MKKVNIYISALFIAVAPISCKKVIKLNLGNQAGKLVVEGNITDEVGWQYIKLSRSVPFTNTNLYPPVTGATIYVTDSENDMYKFNESDTPGTYRAITYQTLYGATFNMKLTVGDTTYTAATTMPEHIVPLDTVTSKVDEFNNDANRRQITVHFQDPPRVANQYRFVMYVNGVQVKTVFAFDDQFTDGRYVSFDLIEEDTPIYRGNLVTVEMQCIDKPIYTYWFSLEQQQPRGPGGGVTPSNPPTNFTPAVLGYFSAHTTQSKTIVVQ